MGVIAEVVNMGGWMCMWVLTIAVAVIGFNSMVPASGCGSKNLPTLVAVSIGVSVRSVAWLPGLAGLD